MEGILPGAGRRRIVILTGARQTGKTTLARVVYPDVRYINLDAPENREAIRLIPSSLWGRDMGNAVLDEGQKEPSLFGKVKYAFDERSISFTVILGSSQILLLKKIRETLAGRVSIYELWPLLMSEAQVESPGEPALLKSILDGKHVGKMFRGVPSVLLDREEALAKDAERHILQWGGMPALLPLSNDERWKWLRDYEYTYLERDLGDLARLDDLEPFRKFQRLAGHRSSRLLSYSELARDTGISVDTAKRYLEYLRLSYQTYLLMPYHRNLTSTVIKTPKLYWMDLGILRHLSGRKSEVSGEMFETMVVGEIMKWLGTVQREEEVYFYRTRSGLEVDLLIETESGFVGMEIKTSEKPGRSDFRSLTELAAALGKAWKCGLVIYRGNRIQHLADPNIWAVPSYRLLSGF